MIRRSKKEKFTNGIMLINLDFDKYNCNKNYDSIYNEKKYFDPIRNEICSYFALKSRIYQNKEKYKNVCLKDCLMTEDENYEA